MLILDQETVNTVWKLHMEGLSAGRISMSTGLLPTRVKDILAGRTYARFKPSWAVRRTPSQEEREVEELFPNIFGVS